MSLLHFEFGISIFSKVRLALKMVTKLTILIGRSSWTLVDSDDTIQLATKAAWLSPEATSCHWRPSNDTNIVDLLANIDKFICIYIRVFAFYFISSSSSITGHCICVPCKCSLLVSLVQFMLKPKYRY